MVKMEGVLKSSSQIVKYLNCFQDATVASKLFLRWKELIVSQLLCMSLDTLTHS